MFRRFILIAFFICFGLWLLSDYFVLSIFSVAASRVRHASIEVVAYDSGGRHLDSSEFMRTWFPNLIVRGNDGYAGLGFQYGVFRPRIAIPAGENVTFDILWPVPGFGKVLLTADNRGRGYKVSAGAYTRIELVPELARSRVEQIQRWIAEHNDGRFSSDSVGDDLSQARSLLTAVDSEPDAARRSSLAGAALRLGMEAGEREVVAEAQTWIRDHRRGTLNIKVIDSNALPVSNAKIHAVQTRPDFLFGVFNYGYDDATIARLKTLGVNSATLHLNWNQTEPERGKFAFTQTDKLLNTAALKDAGFILRGHALDWLLDPVTGPVMPDYMKRFRHRPQALKAEVRSHIAKIVSHYKDKVSIWEANNEGHAAWAAWGLNHSGMDDVIRGAAEEIKHDAPGAPIMINVAAPLGENIPFQFYPVIPDLSRGLVSRYSMDPLQFLQELKAAGVPFDLVGLQFYYGGRRDTPLGNTLGAFTESPAIDLFRLAREIDRYSQLGKPIQITELSVGSQDIPGGRSWWHAPPDQLIQADYLAAAFTIAYGNPHVQAINWWDLYDNHSFIKYGGLVDSAGHPKVAYEKMGALLAGWRTRGDVTADAGGSATFTGAPGDYQVTAESGPATVVGNAHISDNGSDVVVMTMQAVQVKAPPPHARPEPPRRPPPPEPPLEPPPD